MMKVSVPDAEKTCRPSHVVREGEHVGLRWHAGDVQVFGVAVFRSTRATNGSVFGAVSCPYAMSMTTSAAMLSRHAMRTAVQQST